MPKKNMDWRLVDQMRTWVKQDKHVDLSRTQALDILVKAKLVKPNGLPTKKTVEPIKHGASPRINHDIPYRQFIASVPASMIANLKKNKNAMPADKYARDVHALKVSKNTILHTPLNQLDNNSWSTILRAGYTTYWISAKNHVNPKDKDWLYSNFEHLVNEFKKQTNDKGRAEEAVRAMMANIQSRS